MPRTAILYALPALLVASGWRRLEDGGSEGAVLAVLLLALAPALVRPWWGRALAGAGAAVGAVWVVYALPPIALLPYDDRSYFRPVASQFREGLLSFWDVRQPFTVAEHPLMHAVILAAIFGFSLALGLAIAARRPLIASLVVVTGSVWPATLVPGSDLVRGALTLAAVLLLLALGGRRPTLAVRPALLGATLLVVAAVGASTSEAVAKPAFVDWRSWDLYDKPADPVGVGYVWDATYGELTWPEEKTTVLKVSGPQRHLYWRATTLDTFVGDRWIENHRVTQIANAPVDVTQLADPLIPDRAYRRERWVESNVRVEALRDHRLVGASMPVAYDPKDVGLIRLSPGGIASAGRNLPRGAEYTVWSFAPAPRPAQLARVRASRSPALRKYLELAPNVPAPPFRRVERARSTLLPLMERERTLQPYRPLFERARAVVGDPSNQYAAVVSLEAWFRSEGGFRYDESPPPPAGRPPLVAFLEDQRGYCQHFAGAMTLMLRSLGIPSRVAVGFTSGSYSKDDSTWTVTDHDAHAWVEVWFPGWGWLPFDPTPARAQLSGPYTAAAGGAFDVEGAGRVLTESAFGGQIDRIARGLTEARVGEAFVEGAGGSDSGYGPLVRERGASLLRLLIFVAAAVAAAIVLVKRAVRARRYLTRDARRLAAASRQELAEFLLDQGIALPGSATPGELAQELKRTFSIDAGAFASALSTARYAPPEESRAAARAVRREARLLRRELRLRLGVPRRVAGAVSLRSLAA